MSKNNCPDCNGTGQYVGFLKVEPCPTCQGKSTSEETRLLAQIYQLCRDRGVNILSGGDLPFEIMNEEVVKTFDTHLKNGQSLGLSVIDANAPVMRFNEFAVNYKPDRIYGKYTIS